MNRSEEVLHFTVPQKALLCFWFNTWHRYSESSLTMPSIWWTIPQQKQQRKQFCPVYILRYATLIVWYCNSILLQAVLTLTSISIFIFFLYCAVSYQFHAGLSQLWTSTVCKIVFFHISNIHENCHIWWQRSNVTASDEESQCQVALPRKHISQTQSTEHKIFSSAVKT